MTRQAITVYEGTSQQERTESILQFECNLKIHAQAGFTLRMTAQGHLMLLCREQVYNSLKPCCPVHAGSANCQCRH